MKEALATTKDKGSDDKLLRQMMAGDVEAFAELLDAVSYFGQLIGQLIFDSNRTGERPDVH